MLSRPNARARAAAIAVISASDIRHHDLAVRCDEGRRGQAEPAGSARQFEYPFAGPRCRAVQHARRHRRRARVDVVRVLLPRSGDARPHGVHLARDAAGLHGASLPRISLLSRSNEFICRITKWPAASSPSGSTTRRGARSRRRQRGARSSTRRSDCSNAMDTRRRRWTRSRPRPASRSRRSTWRSRRRADCSAGCGICSSKATIRTPASPSVRGTARCSRSRIHNGNYG